MKVLAVDIGAGTQDIFLFDSRQEMENGFKLVLPSPTMIIRKQIQQATRSKHPVFLHGTIMGGGPNSWAVEDHIKLGLRVFSTPQAALTLDDDLEKVKALGVLIVSEDEVQGLPPGTFYIDLQDFNFAIIQKTFALYGVSLNDLSAVAIAAFDHGEAPREISDRKFRFDYLNHQLEKENRLSALAFNSENLPSFLTRLKAISDSAFSLGLPSIVMDSAPAAVLGATYDPLFSQNTENLVINIGNFHTLGFRLSKNGIDGIFEHHTGFLGPHKLTTTIQHFANGTLTNQAIFNDHGHGALIKTKHPLNLQHPGFKIIATGPRRKMLSSSSLPFHFAIPFGDMMIAGCFGLLAAVADHLPEFSNEILAALNQSSDRGVTPWDID